MYTERYVLNIHVHVVQCICSKKCSSPSFSWTLTQHDWKENLLLGALPQIYEVAYPNCSLEDNSWCCSILRTEARLGMSWQVSVIDTVVPTRVWILHKQINTHFYSFRKLGVDPLLHWVCLLSVCIHKSNAVV